MPKVIPIIIIVLLQLLLLTTLPLVSPNLLLPPRVFVITHMDICIYVHAYKHMYINIVYIGPVPSPWAQRL